MSKAHQSDENEYLPTTLVGSQWFLNVLWNRLAKAWFDRRF